MQGQELTYRDSSEGKQEHVGGGSKDKVTQGTEQNADQQRGPPPDHVAPAAL